MNALLPFIRRKAAQRGFSLVEVVLATGIMALGVVTILGLLPHGLEMSRKTANEQAETRIVDLVVGEAQTMNWDAMNNANAPQIRYFDDQGLELQEADDDFKMRLTYVVQVTMPDFDVKLPTNNNNLAANPSLRRVMVKMIAAPLQEFNFENTTPTVPIKVFTQLVANTGLAINLP